MTQSTHPITAIDVARYLVDKQDVDAGDLLSHLPLQKLVYYAQGWSLAMLESPLFEEDVEAWQHGPVIPEVYQHFKEHGANPIPPSSQMAATDALPEDIKLFLDDIWDIYGRYSPHALRKMTHEEAPWVDARGDLPDDDSSNAPISKEALAAFFTAERDRRFREWTWTEPSEEDIEAALAELPPLIATAAE